MRKTAWYLVRGTSPHWEVLKFDFAGIYATTYNVGEAGNGLTCDCYAGNRETCRHRQMIQLFEGKPSGTLYNFDLDLWKEPEDAENL